VRGRPLALCTGIRAKGTRTGRLVRVCGQLAAEPPPPPRCLSSPPFCPLASSSSSLRVRVQLKEAKQRDKFSVA